MNTNTKGVKNVFVCGGGHQGLSMAAHLALNGITVTLWNRTPKNIQRVIDTREIICTGVVNGIAKVVGVRGAPVGFLTDLGEGDLRSGRAGGNAQHQNQSQYENQQFLHG